MTATAVGPVSDIRRYPVKSMLGEQLGRARVTERGVAGDRAYALVDDETGKIVSVKRPKRWGRIFELRAWTDRDTVSVSFPDGPTLAIEDPQLDELLSEFLGRTVSVTATPPPDAGYDEAWAGDLKAGAPPYLGMETTTIDGEEFIDGGAFMRANRNFFDFGAIHLVTTGSTNALADASKQLRSPMISSLTSAAQQGEQFAKQADTADPAQLEDLKHQLDSLTARFKQLSSVVLPRGKQSILVASARSNLTRWRDSAR